MHMFGYQDNRIDVKTVFAIIIMAVMGAIGILALGCGILGISFTQLGWMTSVGMMSGLSGILFGIILLFYLFRR